MNITTISQNITTAITSAVLLTSLSIIPAFADNAADLDHVFNNGNIAELGAQSEHVNECSTESGGMASEGNQAFVGPKDAITDSSTEGPSWADSSSESGGGILYVPAYVPAPQPKVVQADEETAQQHIPEMQVKIYSWNN